MIVQYALCVVLSLPVAHSHKCMRARPQDRNTTDDRRREWSRRPHFVHKRTKQKRKKKKHAEYTTLHLLCHVSEKHPLRKFLVAQLDLSIAKLKMIVLRGQQFLQVCHICHVVHERLEASTFVVQAECNTAFAITRRVNELHVASHVDSYVRLCHGNFFLESELHGATCHVNTLMERDGFYNQLPAEFNSTERAFVQTRACRSMCRIVCALLQFFSVAHGSFADRQ